MWTVKETLDRGMNSYHAYTYSFLECNDKKKEIKVVLRKEKNYEEWRKSDAFARLLDRLQWYRTDAERLEYVKVAKGSFPTFTSDYDWLMFCKCFTQKGLLFSCMSRNCVDECFYILVEAGLMGDSLKRKLLEKYALFRKRIQLLRKQINANDWRKPAIKVKEDDPDN